MLRSIDEIPLTYRPIFKNYKIFNSVQSECFDDTFNTDKSIIISAPTGSGKTVIFELAILRLLQISNQQQEDFKVVYVAPIKALCNERYADWSTKFHPYGLQCLEVTGDTDIQDISDLITAKIIITTPEKWDSLTRKWKDNANIVSAVKLFMIDEIHLLNEDGRGPILEAIVSRMKTIQFSMKIIGVSGLSLRFIGASATIPNIEDLAEWIGGRDLNNISFFQISEERRPVKLEKHILGYTNGTSSFKFDIHLNYKLAEIIRKYSNGKPTLIFCSSRKSVEMASDVLQKYPCLFPLSDNHKAELAQLSRSLQDKKLHGLIIKGIAYHHAGLTYDDRNTIENGFRQGLLLALVSTNTLAMGVNLPAHLVIIKSTEAFIRGAVIEYSESSILQMIGRAGRPQYDVRGVAVIMTQQKYVKKYENLMNGCTPVESHLHKHLAEHLNSEIVLQTITDIDVAMEWIRSTFLYVRAVKSPMNYGLTYGMPKEKVEKKLEEMCLIQINDLETNELITKDQTYGLSINATQYGRLMARYYISFETMKSFRKIRGNESYLEMFNKIIESKEFSEFTLRVNEKKMLNDLNDKPIRFPIKGKIKTNANKVSCLIQANFGTIQIPDPAMMQDSLKMIRLGDRISKCCLEYVRLSEKQLDKNCGIFKALLNIIMIAKSYRAKLWENSEYVCKQLNKIGNVYSSLLVNAGKTTLKSILETEPRTLEMILGKQPPFGNDIHNSLLTFPNYELQLTMKGSGLAQIYIKQINQNYKYTGCNCTVIVGDSDNHLLLLNDKIDFTIQEFGYFDITFKIRNCKTDAIYAHLIHDSLVGVDKTASIILNPLEETDDEIVKKSNSKKRIQTKLSNCPVPQKKSKKSTNLLNEIVNQSERYESLLDDDEIFNNINTQRAVLENKLNYESTIKLPIQDHENYQAKYPDNTNNHKQLPIKRKLSNFEFNEKPKIMKYSNEKIYEYLDNDFEYILQEAEKEQENFTNMQLRYGNPDDSIVCEDDIVEVSNENWIDVAAIGKKWELTEIRPNENTEKFENIIVNNQIKDFYNNVNFLNFQKLETINNQKSDTLNENDTLSENKISQYFDKLHNSKKKLASSSKLFQNSSVLDLSRKTDVKTATFSNTRNSIIELEQNEPLDLSNIQVNKKIGTVTSKFSEEPLRLIVQKRLENPYNLTKNTTNAVVVPESKIKSFMDLEPCFAEQNKENLNPRFQKRKFIDLHCPSTSTVASKLRKADSNLSHFDWNFEEQQFNQTELHTKLRSTNQTHIDQFRPKNVISESVISSSNQLESLSTLNSNFEKQIVQQPLKNSISTNYKIYGHFLNEEHNQKMTKLNNNFGISNMNISSNFSVRKISELWNENISYNQPKQKIDTQNVVGEWDHILSDSAEIHNSFHDDEDFCKNDLDSLINNNTANILSDSGIFSTNNIPEKYSPILMTKSKTLGMTNFNNKLTKPIENIAKPVNLFRPQENIIPDKKIFPNTEFVKASKILDNRNLDEGLIIPKNHNWKNVAVNNKQDNNDFYKVIKVNEDNIPLKKIEDNFEDFIVGINKTPEMKENEINVVDNKMEIEKDSNTIANKYPKELSDVTIKQGIFPIIIQSQYLITQNIPSKDQIIQILQIICIGNISPNLNYSTDIIKIPNYQLHSENQIKDPQMKLFFEENPSKLNKYESFRSSTKLVRLQDIDETEKQPEINIPILNFNLPKPNLIVANTQKLLNVDKRTNPYRLRIPRREKIIPVENRAHLDDQELTRTFALNNLQKRMSTDPNYDENSYMNDYISCLMSKEVTNVFDSFVISQENDINEDDFFESNFNDSQDISFVLSNDEDYYKSLKEYDEEENCNEIFISKTEENNFLLEFSPNLKENSYFDEDLF